MYIWDLAYDGVYIQKLYAILTKRQGNRHPPNQPSSRPARAPPYRPNMSISLPRVRLHFLLPIIPYLPSPPSSPLSPTSP